MVFEQGMEEFGPFLMGPYKTQHCENPMYLKKCTFPMEAASNIIQVRMCDVQIMLASVGLCSSEISLVLTILTLNEFHY